jgi:hypothetical protein
MATQDKGASQTNAFRAFMQLRPRRRIKLGRFAALVGNRAVQNLCAAYFMQLAMRSIVEGSKVYHEVMEAQ